MVVGGQALPGGVVMCGATAWALAVRAPGGGAIEVSTFPRVARRRPAASRVPVLRGLVALAEGLRIGAAAQRRAAPGAHPWRLAAAAVVVLVLAPAALALALVGGVGSGLVLSLVEGGLRAGLLVLGLLLAARAAPVRQAFAHHGAEHKVVACHQAGLPVSPERAAAFSRLHARCGTGLVALMLVVAVPVLAPLGVPGAPALLASRLLAVPLVAGLAFELVRSAGGAAWARALPAPGLWLQRLTTREPGPAELAVAVAALDAVLAAERPAAPADVRLAA